MKLKTLKILSALFVCLLAPATSIALPINYSIQGSIVNQGQTLQISGGMIIDDQLFDWTSNGVPSFSSGAVGYHITGYSLQVGNISFSGASGDLYMMLTAPYNPTAYIYDSMWFLNDIGNQMVGEQFYFFNADGTVRESNEAQYFNLAPLIKLTNLEYMSGDTINSDHSGFNICLTRESSEPVPEPATLLLFGSSLLGMLAYRKVRR